MRFTQQHLAVAIAVLYLSVGALLQAWVQATATKPEQHGTQRRPNQRAPRGISWHWPPEPRRPTAPGLN